VRYLIGGLAGPTSVAPAFRASSAAATRAGRHSSREAIVQTGNIASTAAIGPCERSVEVTGSAATRQVSVSFSAISRAVPNSIPRPIVRQAALAICLAA